MNAERLEKLARRLENKAAKLNEQAQRKYDRAQSLEAEANSIKSTMASAATAAARTHAQNAGRQDADKAVLLANRRYQSKLNDKLDRSKEIKSEADQIQKDAAEAENLGREVGKHAGFMRDYEIKAQSWADQARQLLAR